METSSRKWQPIYFSIFSVTVVITIVTTTLIDKCSNCIIWLDWLELIKSATANGVLYSTAIVSVIEVMRMVMLPADYLRQKFIEPLKERQKEEGRAEGLAEGLAEGRTEGRSEGLAEGRTEGRAEMRQEFLNWLQRKEAAERQGGVFTEPMPDAKNSIRTDEN